MSNSFVGGVELVSVVGSHDHRNKKPSHENLWISSVFQTESESIPSLTASYEQAKSINSCTTCSFWDNSDLVVSFTVSFTRFLDSHSFPFHRIRSGSFSLVLNSFCLVCWCCCMLCYNSLDPILNSFAKEGMWEGSTPCRKCSRFGLWGIRFHTHPLLPRFQLSLSLGVGRSRIS